MEVVVYGLAVYGGWLVGDDYKVYRVGLRRVGS